MTSHMRLSKHVEIHNFLSQCCANTNKIVSIGLGGATKKKGLFAWNTDGPVERGSVR